MNEPRKATLSVRLSDSQLAQVQRLAKLIGCDKADVVRWAIDALEAYAALHGGKLMLPLNFTETWQKTRPADPAAN